MQTSGEKDFRFRLKLKITLVESTYPSQRPECPSLSPHFLLILINDIINNLILFKPEVLFSIALGKSSDALSSSMVLNVTVISAVKVTIAITTEGFSSVINSVVSPGPKITVRAPNRTLMVKASQSASTAVSLDVASFTSTVLPSAQVSLQPTAALTVKPTTTSSVNGK